MVIILPRAGGRGDDDASNGHRRGAAQEEARPPQRAILEHSTVSVFLHVLIYEVLDLSGPNIITITQLRLKLPPRDLPPVWLRMSAEQ